MNVRPISRSVVVGGDRVGWLIRPQPAVVGRSYNTPFLTHAADLVQSPRRNVTGNVLPVPTLGDATNDGHVQFRQPRCNVLMPTIPDRDTIGYSIDLENAKDVCDPLC